MQGAGGVGGLLSVKDGNDTYYPTFDGNGNVSEYVDATGNVVAHYEYDAFGQVVASGTKKDDFTHQFSTKQLDSESGLHYYGYRYYDSSTGSWINRDPIAERGGLNIYGFIGNNSINQIDILGNAPGDQHQTLAAATSSAAKYLAGETKRTADLGYNIFKSNYIYGHKKYYTTYQQSSNRHSGRDTHGARIQHGSALI